MTRPRSSSVTALPPVCCILERFMALLLLLSMLLAAEGTARASQTQQQEHHRRHFRQASAAAAGDLQQKSDGYTAAAEDDYVLSFQEDGKLSNTTFAAYKGGGLPNMDRFTICYWLNLRFHHTTISLASYCAPSHNCTPTRQKPSCSNIQYHLESKQWEEVRVEFSINAVKTKSLKAKINPKAWTHHCITYNNDIGQVKFYSHGKQTSSAILKKNAQTPRFPGEGILILGQEQETLCGGFDDYDSLSGDLTEFQIWDSILDEDTLHDLAHCHTDMQGNVINWRKSRNLWSLSDIHVKPGLRSKFLTSRGHHGESGDASSSCSLCHGEGAWTRGGGGDDDDGDPGGVDDRRLIVFPERRTVEVAEHLCAVHGGHLPVPENSWENKVMAQLGKTYEPVCSEAGKENLNQPYVWLGLEDPEGSGRWRLRQSEHRDPVSYTNWDENEGSEGDTCARMQGSGKWRDTVCKKSVRHCVICHMPDPQQVFTLRGLCDDTQIDRGYFLTNGQAIDVDTSNMRPVYEGYFSKIDWFKADSEVGLREMIGTRHEGLILNDDFAGFWRINSRIPQKDWRYIAITNMTNQIGYPVGRHEWLVKDPKCDLFEPVWLNLTLSRCLTSEFTCADGTCIDAKKRCDLVQDCRDFTDELNCDTVILPHTYLKHPPTMTSSESLSEEEGERGPVEVKLFINIYNIDRIDTVHMMFALTMEYSLEWRDHRLKYKNLKENFVQNQLSKEETDQIWMPNVVLTNAKIGEMKADPFSVMVRKESEPEDFSYASPVEDKIYLGADNSLVLSTKVYAEYGCTFDLRDFPFDNQRCKMNFSMASAKASYIVLTTTKRDIKYHGDKMLLEFKTDDWFPDDGGQTDEGGKSMISVNIIFHRELGNMVNTYFQTFLLCLMAYLTLYINLADFGNRFMGALTSLLVLASLLASIEENLPKTSYFKKIDIWFMSYIIFIFVIICFHICVDFCAGHGEEFMTTYNNVPTAPGGGGTGNHRVGGGGGGMSRTGTLTRAISFAMSGGGKRTRMGSAAYLNNWGKIVFPIVLIVFTTLYFVISVVASRS